MQPPPRGTRGKVTEFSAKSRKRMLEKMARLCRQQIHQSRFKPLFVTLTYPSTYPTAKRAKEHLRAFLKRLKRAYGRVGAIWRLEFQERGAPHFHLLLFGLPFPKPTTLQAMWCEVTDTTATNSLDVEVLRSLNGVMYYVSKYMAKPDDDGETDTEAQDAGGDAPLGLSVCHNCPGRFWGVWGAAHIPWAQRRVFTAIVAAGAACEAGRTLGHAYASAQYSFTVFSGKAQEYAHRYTRALHDGAFENAVAASEHAGAWGFWQSLGGAR